MARSLHFQASVPLIYRGDCVLTAVHLINRTPSSVLNMKTPYEALYEKEPEYEPLKIFGCLVFAYNTDIHVDKFSMRGIPCVLLGYPANKKGYKLLNIVNKQTFTSRDVKFYESIFPFNTNSENLFMTPVPNQTTIQTNHAVDDLLYSEIYEEPESPVIIHEPGSEIPSPSLETSVSNSPVIPSPPPPR